MVLDIIGNIADVLGIIGFALTIVLLIKSEALRKEIEAQNKTYKRERQQIKGHFQGLLDLVRENTLLHDNLIDDVRIAVNTLEQRFSRIMGRKDRMHLKTTHFLLDSFRKGNNRDVLCKELAYFIARMERVEKS